MAKLCRLEKGGVCKKCNNIIGKIEQPTIKALAPIRNFLQLTGKRERPALKLQLEFADTQLAISVHHPQDLDSRLFAIKKALPDGKSKIAFVGPREKIADAQKEYHKKYPKTIWEEMKPGEISEMKFYMDFDLAAFANPLCLRMIAKIALEWWASKRNPSIIKQADFEPIRNFILKGNHAEYPIVSIVQEKRLLDCFRDIWFGIHTLFYSIDPRSQNLIIFVGLFSFVYYKVVVTRSHPALAKIEHLATINPQTGVCYEPTIRISLSPGPYVSNITRYDCVPPFQVVRNMKPYLIDRINKGFEMIKQRNR